MTPELFQRLLYESEGDTLDFKVEQYPFDKATIEQKAELLKDILAFANAWRRSDAFILIGVRESKIGGVPSEVIGIPASAHLADHSLQQFVSSKATPVVKFRYYPFEYQGKQVGILHFKAQQRPVFVKEDYGSLRKNCVPVRHGSTTAMADPNEIIAMKSGQRSEAALSLTLGKHDQRTAMAEPWAFETRFVTLTDVQEIPDYVRNRDNFLGLASTLDRENRDFWRNAWDYFKLTLQFVPIRLVIANVSENPARRVRLEISVPLSEGFVIRDSIPDFPSRQHSIDFSGMSKATTGMPISQLERDSHETVIEFDDLQPGRSTWSEVFYIGVRKTGDYIVNANLFSDDFREPIILPLRFNFTVAQSSWIFQDLVDAVKTLEEG